MQPEEKSRERRRTARVGGLVLVALTALGVGVFLIGDRNNLFSSKNRYQVRFENVGGLVAGSPVQLGGVDVGSVQEVVLPEDPAEHRLLVELSLDRRYADRIRDDSRARIKTLGLLGDKYVEITSGLPESAVIADGGEIQAADERDVDRLLASGEDVVQNIVVISHSLTEILDRMVQGQGVLGELMRPREPGEPTVMEYLGTIVESVERVSGGLEEGRGPLPRLIHDRALGDRLASSVERLDTLLASFESGDGLGPALLHDAELKEQVEGTLARLEEASHSLATTAQGLTEGDGLLPRLINDEVWAQDVVDELRQILQRLSFTLTELAEGEGTVPRLIRDPSVYEALEDVVVGIDESRLLRWLVRNRQKAGIEKRYKEERAEGVGTEAPPIPPPEEGDLPEGPQR